MTAVNLPRTCCSCGVEHSVIAEQNRFSFFAIICFHHLRLLSPLFSYFKSFVTALKESNLFSSRISCFDVRLIDTSTCGSMVHRLSNAITAQLYYIVGLKSHIILFKFFFFVFRFSFVHSFADSISIFR